MNNYTNSDYALNKYSEGIVYRFADKIVEITIADYLAENPDKTDVDFLDLKKISDTDYHDEVKATYRHTWKDMPDADADDSLFYVETSAEETYFGAIEIREQDSWYQEQVDIVLRALGKLTAVQRRRYLMYHMDGLKTRQIAEIEGCKHQSIVECLAGADKKIKKVLAKG